MQTIHKFPVLTDGSMPDLRPGPILHIGLDPESRMPAFWVLCDDQDDANVPAPYVMVGTGYEIPPEAGPFVATVTGVRGPLVFHFFHRL
ncbi:MAG: DUF7352 domain-containing protein [Gammaproteobacteria bacterium]